MSHRRLTPSMSLLLAFEAAARHESYTKAADELSLTQSAVSRQVLNLEQQLEVTLFRRDGRNVRLTGEGRRYFEEIRAALARIRGATLQVMSQRLGHGVLRLATLPTLGSKWLLPRLNDFYARHPGVTLHVHSRISELDFTSDQIDAAITVGEDERTGLVSRPLFRERLIAVAHSNASVEPEKLDTQTLLTVANNPHAWSAWFLAHDLDLRNMRPGPSFELTSHLIQAVQARMGVGIVPEQLVKDDLESGELEVIGTPIVSRRVYSLVYPATNATLPALEAFEGWLLAMFESADD